MAVIERLRIHSVRNLREVDIAVGPGVTSFVGGNGAGKTALLESVYLLSRGRSFRGARHGSVVGHGQPVARIEALIRDRGVHRRLRWEGRERGAAAAPTAPAPSADQSGVCVRLICDATHALVAGEPSLRRRFLDWNVFHVEPAYGDLRAAFRRVASQRNAWLRAGGTGPAVWDEAYVNAITQIERQRARFFGRLGDAFAALVGDGRQFCGLVPRWAPACGDEADTLARLMAMRTADVSRGYSFLGPARADFAFWRHGRRWAGSRGEAKLVGCLLQLAADIVVRSLTGQASIWLVDDLAAELSAESQALVLGMIRENVEQVLMTALPGGATEGIQDGIARLFHVEQGSVRPAPEPDHPTSL